MPTLPIHWLPHLVIRGIAIFEVCWFKKRNKFSCVDVLWGEPRHKWLLARVFPRSVEHLSKVMLAFTEESNSNVTLYKSQEFNTLKKKEVNNLSNLRNLGELGVLSHSLPWSVALNFKLCYRYLFLQFWIIKTTQTFRKACWEIFHLTGLLLMITKKSFCSVPGRTVQLRFGSDPPHLMRFCTPRGTCMRRRCN